MIRVVKMKYVWILRQGTCAPVMLAIGEMMTILAVSCYFSPIVSMTVYIYVHQRRKTHETTYTQTHNTYLTTIAIFLVQSH